jgi:hypothetical protein
MRGAMRLKPIHHFAIWLCLFTTPIIFFTCFDGTVEPDITLITEDGYVLLEASCMDTTSTIFITAPNYTFDSVDLAFIWDFGIGQASDTFFLDGILLEDAYLALANTLGIVDSLVCSGTVYNPSTTELSITGHIGAESYSEEMGIAVKVFDHPGVYVLGVFFYTP